MMSHRILALVKSLREWAQNSLNSLAKVYYIFRTQRELLLCPILHYVIVFGAKVGVIPFTVHQDQGFRILTPAVGVQKWVNKFILSFIVCRGMLVIPLGFSSEMQWTVDDGLLTADFLLWLNVVTMEILFTAICKKLLFNARDIQLINNCVTQQSKALTRECTQGKHILECKGRKNPWIFNICAITALSMISIPLIATAAIFNLKDSPILIAYMIVGPYDGTKSDPLLTVLYWSCHFVEWLNLTYDCWVLIATMTLLSESLISSALLFEGLRYAVHVPWTTKIRYHARSELITSMFNDLADVTLPVGICLGFMVASTSITMLIKMDLAMGFPPVGMVPGLCVLAMGSVVVPFLLLSFGEACRNDSVVLLKEMEDEITTYFRLKAIRAGGNNNDGNRPTGRLFRRRPLGLRFGNFMHIHAGLCVTFIMQVFDNTVTLVFMTDLWAIPMWLM